jgi:hypothetical protein
VAVLGFGLSFAEQKERRERHLRTVYATMFVMARRYKIIGYDGLNLNSNEAKVAKVLSVYLRADVKILKPINHFKVSTPDYVIAGDFWELKTVISHKIDKLEDRLGDAENQAPNIVIDIRQTTIHYRRASQTIRKVLGEKNHIARVLLITKEKDRKVLDFVK